MTSAVVADATLVRVASVFTAGVLVHNADHVRRGADAVTPDVFWTGTAAIVLEIAVVAVICGRHHLAPAAAAIVGAGLALGYLTVHFTPQRGWLSDSFPSATDVSPISWFAASFELAASLLLTAAGLAAVRAAGGFAAVRAATPVPGALVDGFRHPVAIAMAAGNAVVLAASVAQAAT